VLKKEYNVTNFLWDLSLSVELNKSKLKEAIVTNDISVVMCSGTYAEANELNLIYQLSKEISRDIVTIIGGALPSWSPNEVLLMMPDCDIAVIGEGEITVCELMRVIEIDGEISAVKGIIYRENGSVMISDSREELPDLAKLPMPDHEGVFGEWLRDHDLFVVSSGRGCNYACTFCTKHGKRYRERPFYKLFEELDYYVPKYNIRGLYYINEFFNNDSTYVDTFCNKIKSFKVPYLFTTRLSDTLTEEVLIKLRESGVSDILFGLESANNSVLKSMRKGTNVELMERALKMAKAARLNILGGFIIGDTIETNETVQNTLRFISENRDLLPSPTLTMIVLWPGSQLYDKAVKEGRINPLKHLADMCPAINVSKLSDEEYMYYQSYYFNMLFHTEIDRDLNIVNINSKRIGTSLFNFTFQCAKCYKTHEYTLDLSIEIASQNIKTLAQLFCGCGERLKLEYFYHTINKEAILNSIKSQRTAFYGIGNVFHKLYYKCDLESCETQYFLLDARVQPISTQKPINASIESKVQQPDVMLNENIKSVIVTIMDSGNRILSNLKTQYPSVEFVMWYDFFDCESNDS